MPKSIANFQLAQQVSQVLASARRDTYDSAVSMRANLPGKWTTAFTAEQVRNQGTALVALLDKIAANSAAIQTACTEWDVDYAALVESYNEIRQAAEAMRDAAVNGSNVAARLDAIISGLPRGTILF